MASTAGPDTRIRMRAPPLAGSSAITSSTSASKLEIVVPRTTERALQLIPARTSESGMIGSAASAPGAATALPRRARRSARRVK